MLRRQLPDPQVVHLDQRHPEPWQCTGGVDQRFSHRDHAPSELGVEQVGDDAVRLPFAQRGQHPHVRRGVAEHPLRLVARIGANAAHHPATISQILPHQQCNASYLAHGSFRHSCGSQGLTTRSNRRRPASWCSSPCLPRRLPGTRRHRRCPRAWPVRPWESCRAQNCGTSGPGDAFG